MLLCKSDGKSGSAPACAHNSLCKYKSLRVLFMENSQFIGIAPKSGSHNSKSPQSSLFNIKIIHPN
ncbi:hypothetical protein BDI24065_03585 [Burkholderia diffusa]|uniref:Uncharacterized protein n=1 Tax=Burkholderia diffusa TaxID=488732 RepID=A0A6P2LXM5_9BURK|nr:hypothetical protein BDI24065_03585 [Burkholderia diffusa]